MLGSKSLGNRIQYRFQKAAEAVLIKNDIGRFECELGNDVCVPSIPHENPAFTTIQCQHDRPHRGTDVLHRWNSLQDLHRTDQA